LVAQFVETNRELLSQLPPPLAAVAYYRSADLYLFDAVQTCSQGAPRRPPCNTLLDVFENIRCAAAAAAAVGGGGGVCVCVRACVRACCCRLVLLRARSLLSMQTS
jgi:hypothetical protein